MRTPGHEIANIINDLKDQLPAMVSNTWKQRTLYAIARCRTAAMGGHIDRCSHPECGKLHISYNSCRNRHCPKCQGHLREKWIAKREADLIKVSYFHVVFTLPDHLNQLALQQPKLIYGLLFATAWEVIRDFGANPKMLGARMGMIAVLHTWGQNLSLHPHLHCIVPAGGITVANKWKSTKSRFLFPVKAMGKVFRAKFVEGLRKKATVSTSLSHKLFAKPWVVYAKCPFFGPRQVIEYLGRYTHKIAISNSRIHNVSDGQVCFRAKDYRQAAKPVLLKLDCREFIRRFALHIMPKGYTRIRHFGILNGRVKGANKKIADQQMGPIIIDNHPIPLHRICPHCKKGKMQTIFAFDQRGPPLHWWLKLQGQKK
jgi:hypothetical protein